MRDLDDFYSALGSQIRRKRVDAELTQEQLADALALNRTSVTNIEKGKQRILLHTFVQIAEILKMDLTDLMPLSSRIRSSPTVSGVVPKGTTNIQREFLKSIIGRSERVSKRHESSPKIHRKSS